MKNLKLCLGLLVLTSCGKEEVIEKKDTSHKESVSDTPAPSILEDVIDIKESDNEIEEAPKAEEAKVDEAAPAAEDAKAEDAVPVPAAEDAKAEDAVPTTEATPKLEEAKVEQSANLEEQADKLILLLPINWTVEQKVNLSVVVPEGYKSLQALKAFSDPVANVEFVPQAETDATWTRIVTVTKLTGQSISAENFVTALKDMMSKQAENVKVLKSDVTKEATYEKIYLALAYDYEGKHEVFAAQYFSGPLDLTGVQYTLRPTAGQSDEAALEEIESFFNNQVKVIN